MSYKIRHKHDEDNETAWISEFPHLEDYATGYLVLTSDNKVLSFHCHTVAVVIFTDVTNEYEIVKI